MEHFNTANTIAYLIFSLFAHNLQLYARNFRGASQAAEAVISVAGLLSMVVEYGFLFYYGYKVVWWAPIGFFLASLAIMFITGRMQNILGAPVLGLLGLIVLPVCAYIMFTTVPAV